MEEGCNKEVCGPNRRCLSHSKLLKYHKSNCCCVFCKIKRGEYNHTEKTKEKIRQKNKGRIAAKHESECQCCFCKGKRGEYKGKNNPNFNNHKLAGKNNPMFGKDHTKEAKEKIRIGNIEHCKLHGSYIRTEEHKEKMRHMKRLLSQDVKYENKRIKNVLKSVCACPNIFETNALTYLNSIYDNKFIYTGDGSFIVSRRSADAYSQELHTVALFNGIYWHLKGYGFKNTEQAKGAIELIESIPFLEAGYKVIFIWEDELYDANKNIKHILKDSIYDK